MDGRVSYVTLTEKGKTKFVESLERAEKIARSMLPNTFAENIEKISLFLTKVAASIPNVPVR